MSIIRLFEEDIQKRKVRIREQLLEVSTAQGKTLQDIEKGISSFNTASQQDKFSLMDKVVVLEPEEVFKFKKRSSLFRSFCKKTTLPHIKQWASELKDRQGFGCEIILLDGTQRYSIADQYAVYYLLNEFQRLDQSDHFKACCYLDLACEFDSLKALVKRCEVNRDVIKNINANESEKDIIFSGKKIFEDVKLMGELYGTIGHLHAALVLLELGNYYKPRKEEGAGALSKSYYEHAVKEYLSGKVLTEKEISLDMDIYDAITKDPEMAIFGDGKPYQKWDSINAIMLTVIDNDNIRFTKLWDDAKGLINKNKFIL
jgi:hypothetical protein